MDQLNCEGLRLIHLLRQQTAKLTILIGLEDLLATSPGRFLWLLLELNLSFEKGQFLVYQRTLPTFVFLSAPIAEEFPASFGFAQTGRKLIG